MSGWAVYADIGEVYEISALYDDTLKKKDEFNNYAVKVANCILEDLGINVLATYGKWGARIEPEVNPHLTKGEIEYIANQIKRHRSWIALKVSTHVFTYGENNNKVRDYQVEAEVRAKETARKAHKYVLNLTNKNSRNDKK